MSFEELSDDEEQMLANMQKVFGDEVPEDLLWSVALVLIQGSEEGVPLCIGLQKEGRGGMTLSGSPEEVGQLLHSAIKALDEGPTHGQ